MKQLRETGGSWLLCTPTPESVPVLGYVTEWGVERIICVTASTGTVPLLDLASAQHAVAEAGQRSSRASLPEIGPWTSLPTALGAVREVDRTLFVLDELQEGPDLAEACRGLPAGRIALLVGPRSGFGSRERAVLRAAKPAARHVSLGPRQFSPEAAACAAVVVVQYLAELAPDG